jgi:hypothetical protein
MLAEIQIIRSQIFSSWSLINRCYLEHIATNLIGHTSKKPYDATKLKCYLKEINSYHKWY